MWRVALDPAVGSEQAKTRPCVVVQRNAANRPSPITIVCPITDANGSPGSLIAVRIKKGDGGLRKDSLALCNQIRTVSKLRMRSLQGVLKAKEMDEIDRGLRAILDL